MFNIKILPWQSVQLRVQCLLVWNCIHYDCSKPCERDTIVIWIFLTVQSVPCRGLHSLFAKSIQRVYFSSSSPVSFSQVQGDSHLSNNNNSLPSSEQWAVDPGPWWPCRGIFCLWINLTFLPFLPTCCDRREAEDCKFNSPPASPACPAWLGQSRTNSAAKMLVQTEKSPGGSQHFFTWAAA